MVKSLICILQQTITLITFTKVLDCFTTFIKLKFHYQERNILVRNLMLEFGVKNTICGGFLFATLLAFLFFFLAGKRLDFLFYKGFCCRFKHPIQGISKMYLNLLHTKQYIIGVVEMIHLGFNTTERR